MTQPPPAITREGIPLEHARQICRGPRMDSALSQVLKAKIQSLGDSAACLTLPEGTSASMMKNRILRVVAELNSPMTIRHVSGGIFFWCSVNEDLKQANEVAQRLQAAWRKGLVLTWPRPMRIADHGA
jgi:hypothetical protein